MEGGRGGHAEVAQVGADCPGAAAVLLCAALALLLGPHLGDSWPFLLLPGAIIFACLNPELWRGD